MGDVKSLVFAGFNGWVAALDRHTGELVWYWECPRPQMGNLYVSLLLDRDRLIVSVNGYMYCLDPTTGEQLWHNPLRGFGTGVAALVSVNQPASAPLGQQAAAHTAASEAAHAGLAGS